MTARRAAIALTLAAVAWCSPASAGAAGSYQVSVCNFAAGAVNNSWTWATSDPAEPAHFAEHVTCPYRLAGGGTSDQEGGLSTTDALGLSSDAAPGTSAGWTFTAPTGTSITGLTYERYIGHSLDPKNSWVPALRVDGSIVPGESCLDTVENGETCSVGGPPNTGAEPARITGLLAHELSLGIVCEPPTERECVTGATQHAAWATMYGATVTLSDTAPPSLGAPSGGLWGSGAAGGFHKGTETVTVAAQDVGGGVASFALAANGHTLESYNAACDFTFAQPCPSSIGNQTLTLSTGELTDGPHVLTMVAIDAAGNQSSVASEEIVVDNGAPPAPVGLSAAATTRGGTAFTVDWSDPPGLVAPVTGATYEVCPASGAGACGAPATAPAAGPAVVTVPGPGTWNIIVWLTNAAGNSNPANAGRVTVSVPTASSTGSGGLSKLHIAETLRGRYLLVRVSGPANSRVRVGFTGRLRGRMVAADARSVLLKAGRARLAFRLGPRTAARALIRVSARLEHEAAVTSTLNRRAH